MSSSYFINADHNGVYRWESQLAQPGDETEKGFRPFSNWRRINTDAATNYYNITTLKRIPSGWCPTKLTPWTPEVAHCRDNVFAETSTVLPRNLPPGPTVVRWIWFGALTTNGTRVNGPEHSLFVNWSVCSSMSNI